MNFFLKHIVVGAFSLFTPLLLLAETTAPLLTDPQPIAIAPSPLAVLAPSPLAVLAPSPLAVLAPSPLAVLAPSPLAVLAPSPLAVLAPSLIALTPTYPVVTNIRPAPPTLETVDPTLGDSASLVSGKASAMGRIDLYEGDGCSGNILRSLSFMNPESAQYSILLPVQAAHLTRLSATFTSFANGLTSECSTFDASHPTVSESFVGLKATSDEEPQFVGILSNVGFGACCSIQAARAAQELNLCINLYCSYQTIRRLDVPSCAVANRAVCIQRCLFGYNRDNRHAARACAGASGMPNPPAICYPSLPGPERFPAYFTQPPCPVPAL